VKRFLHRRQLKDRLLKLVKPILLRPWVTALLVALVLNLDMILLGDLMPVRIHDTFDSYMPWMSAMAQNIHEFGVVSQMPNALGGGTALHAPLVNVLMLMQLFLPLPVVYVLQSILAVFVGYLGTFLLLRDDFHLRPLAAIAGALFFVGIPVYPYGQLMIAGIPLLLWSFQRLFDRGRMWRTFILPLSSVLLYFVSSMFVLISFAVIPFQLAFWAWGSGVRRTWSEWIRCGLVWLMYPLLHLPALTEIWSHAAVSQRAAVEKYIVHSWSTTIQMQISEMTNIQTWDWSLGFPTLLGCVLIILWLLSRGWKDGRPARFLPWSYVVIISVVFMYRSPLGGWLSAQLGVLQNVNFERFNMLLVVVFALWVGVSVDRVLRLRASAFSSVGRMVWVMIVFGVAFVIWHFLSGTVGLGVSHLDMNSVMQGVVPVVVQGICLCLALVLLVGAKRRDTERAWAVVVVLPFVVFALLNTAHLHVALGFNSLRSYTKSPQAEMLADQEKGHLDEFRVAVVGLSLISRRHPAQLMLHGFSTAGGYSSLYPQTYKDVWALAIAPELKYSESTKEYFMGFGGRAYLFDTFNDGAEIERPMFDPDILGMLGVKYLFSERPISDPVGIGVREIFRPEVDSYGINRFERYTRPAEWYVYELEERLPIAFATSALRRFQTDDQLLAAISEANAEELADATYVAGSDWDGVQLDTADCEAPQVLSMHFEPDAITVEVEARTSAILNVLVNRHENWICRIDGVPVEIRSAYHTFMAVSVEPGVHTVEFTYESVLQDLAWRFALVGVPAVLVFLFFGELAGFRRTICKRT